MDVGSPHACGRRGGTSRTGRRIQSGLTRRLDAIAGAIGRRLGEMHAILARETTNSAFSPKTADDGDATEWAKKPEQRLQKAVEAIAGVQTWQREQDQERAQELVNRQTSIAAAVRALGESGRGMLMTRIHGDFHLGQVLVASGDAHIIDFEGEPATPIAERRAKTNPLRDVAGLLRSIDYVGATLIDRRAIRAVPVEEAQRDQLIDRFRARTSTSFLRAYWEASGSSGGGAARALLDLFLIEKAAYEITYEVANRPTWIGVPLAGMARLVARITEKETEFRGD